MSFCATSTFAFIAANSIFDTPSRLPFSTSALETRARSHISQVFGSSQVSMISTLRSEASVEVCVTELRLESVNSLPQLLRLVCSSTSAFLTDTWIISDKLFNAFCLAVARRSERGTSALSDTPAAKKCCSVTVSGLSIHAGLGPPPVQAAANADVADNQAAATMSSEEANFISIAFGIWPRADITLSPPDTAICDCPRSPPDSQHPWHADGSSRVR